MKKKSLKTKVYKALRHDIVSGKIKGGTRVTEVAVAESLKVSRTPVREALQKLAQERLLISIPKSGFMVEDLSDDDIQDLFTIRTDIEQIAVSKAIQYITAEELKALDDNLEKTKTAIKTDKDLVLTELDAQFHSIIYTAARSRSLFRVCKNFSDMTLKYRHGLNRTASLRSRMLKHHLEIYQALIAKNAESAAQAMADHGKEAKTHLKVVMKKIRSDNFDRDDD